MSPRPDVSEERRIQILNAASEVFVEKGFQKARMDDIAERSNLSKGTLYWYFKGKDSIVIDLFERIFLREKEDLQGLNSSNLSTKDKLLLYTDRVIIDVERLLKFAPVAYEFLSLAFRHKYFQRSFKKYFKHHLDILVPIIQQGIENNELKDVNPEETAIAIGAIFEGTFALWVYDSDLVNPTYHIKTGIHLLLEGLIR